MIERRFKSEYDSSYKQIRKVIANYITLLMYAPENFDVTLPRKDIIVELTKYFNETDDEELCFLFADIYSNASSDFSFLAAVFSFFFNIIHTQNIESKPTFFNMEKLRKNLSLLTLLFDKCPLTAQAFVQENGFNPPSQNGKQLQFNSFLSVYLFVAVFEVDLPTLKSQIPPNKSQGEIEGISKSYNSKINEYFNEFAQLVYTLYSVNDTTRSAVNAWVYQIINLNLERIKMYANHQVTSSIGFLLNILIISLKIFFDQQTILKLNHSEFLFKVISEIDPLFSVSTVKINFSKFDRTNNELAKEIVDNETEEQNKKEPNLNTELFFIVNSLLSITIKSLDDEFTRMNNKYDELNKKNDPQR